MSKNVLKTVLVSKKVQMWIANNIFVEFVIDRDYFQKCNGEKNVKSA